MNSPQTTTSELQAVADAIRDHERFLVTTHENPDGDALGSLLATKVALDQLGKDSVMVLHGDAPLPGRRLGARPPRAGLREREPDRRPGGVGARAPDDRPRPSPRQFALRRR